MSHCAPYAVLRATLCKGSAENNGDKGSSILLPCAPVPKMHHAKTLTHFGLKHRKRQAPFLKNGSTLEDSTRKEGGRMNLLTPIAAIRPHVV